MAKAKRVICRNPRACGPVPRARYYPVIFLEAIDSGEGGCWCEDLLDEMGCPECGAEPMAYVRADVAMSGRKAVLDALNEAGFRTRGLAKRYEDVE